MEQLATGLSAINLNGCKSPPRCERCDSMPKLLHNDTTQSQISSDAPITQPHSCLSKRGIDPSVSLFPYPLPPLTSFTTTFAGQTLRLPHSFGVLQILPPEILVNILDHLLDQIFLPATTSQAIEARRAFQHLAATHRSLATTVANCLSRYFRTWAAAALARGLDWKFVASTYDWLHSRKPRVLI